MVVATYGTHDWWDLGTERAVPSAHALGLPVVRCHAATLQEARNGGLAQVTTPWVVHLDADDELEHNYLNALHAAVHLGADIIGPAVRYIRPGWPSAGAYVPKVSGHTHVCHARCLREGNWLVVGSVARTELLRDVGGWGDQALYEDWDLWVRAWRAGAVVNACTTAVYRAHMRLDSRNRAPDQAEKDHWHHAIYDANFGEPVS